MTATLPDEVSTRTTHGDTYRVDCCHNGGAPVPAAEIEEDDRHNGVVMGIGLLVAAVETAVLLAML